MLFSSVTDKRGRCFGLLLLTLLLHLLPAAGIHAQSFDMRVGPFQLGGRQPNERLAEAVCAGRLTDAKRALEDGASVHASSAMYDASGPALFLNAICSRGDALAEGDRITIAKLLIDAGAEVAQRGAVHFPGAKVPMAPLIAAAYTNRPELVAYLLEKGAPVNDGDAARDGTAFHWAAEGSCVRCVPVLLAQGANLEHRNKMGLTPLFVAAARGDAEFVAKLLTHGADPFVKEAMGRRVIDEAGNEKVRDLLRSAQLRIYATYGAGLLAALFAVGAGVFLLRGRETPEA